MAGAGNSKGGNSEGKHRAAEGISEFDQKTAGRLSISDMMMDSVIIGNCMTRRKHEKI